MENHIPDRLYLDHAATTPVLPAARAAIADAWGRWANPSSPHAEGRAARAELERARQRIKAALGWPHAIIFTGGASEAAALAMARTVGQTRLVSAVEHDAVRRAAPDAAILAVGADGLVDPDALPEARLFAIQSVNSETGVIQPAALGDAIHAKGGLWLADCAQSAAKLPLPDADLIIVSAHKLGGPPGVGAVLVRDLAMLAAVGGQEQGYRGGTENLPAILGFAAALEARGARAHLPGLRAMLDDGVRARGGEVVAEASPRLAEIASYRIAGRPAAAQLIELDLAGIAVSAGSACSSGSLKPSPVLLAMGWDETRAREVIRVSLAPETSESDIARFLDSWGRIVGRARAA